MNSKILIVDNNKDTLELLNSYFGGKYEFIAAYDAEDAILKFNTVKDIELIITELSLPKMDGIALIEQLMTLITYQRIVVIALYGDLKNLRLAINAGANDFIVKPFDFDDIETVINNALSKSKNNKHKVVKYIQKYLKELGYYKDSIDGSFGPNTEKAVKEFQAKVVKLKKPDGVITAGNNTWKKLLQG